MHPETSDGRLILWKKTILDELNRIREEEAAEFNYDIRALAEHYKQIAATSGRPHVSLPPQRIETPAAQKRPSTFTLKPDRIKI